MSNNTNANTNTNATTKSCAEIKRERANVMIAMRNAIIDYVQAKTDDEESDGANAVYVALQDAIAIMPEIKDVNVDILVAIACNVRYIKATSTTVIRIRAESYIYRALIQCISADVEGKHGKHALKEKKVSAPRVSKPRTPVEKVYYAAKSLAQAEYNLTHAIGEPDTFTFPALADWLAARAA